MSEHFDRKEGFMRAADTVHSLDRLAVHDSCYTSGRRKESDRSDVI
jgi:hypothetical protein